MQVTLHVELPHWGEPVIRRGAVRTSLLRALWQRHRLKRQGWAVRLSL
jgi:hypothetical protein